MKKKYIWELSWYVLIAAIVAISAYYFNTWLFN